MADSSNPITSPKLIQWSTKQIYDHTEQIADYEDLEALGHAITAARIALFTLTEKINEYERKEREAKVRYDRAFRRAYLESIEKTESQKRMRAELTCENLENEYIAADQLKSELVRMSHSLRLELQTLQTVGNNIRQQMKME
jgi:predicted RNase H-like nuclease (RuvC/YqgF family)